MNSKPFILTLLLGLVLIGLAGLHLISPITAAPTDALGESAAKTEESVELTFSFKVKIRLPLLKKDAI